MNTPDHLETLDGWYARLTAYSHRKHELRPKLYDSDWLKRTLAIIDQWHSEGNFALLRRFAIQDEMYLKRIDK